jgi:hypothetical protein
MDCLANGEFLVKFPVLHICKSIIPTMLQEHVDVVRGYCPTKLPDYILMLRDFSEYRASVSAAGEWLWTTFTILAVPVLR